ncbi:MAG: serine hydrolase domain-containing protein [Pseudomonadales bacterium]|nr:serine hydrolase domain-containing protein [Pseudomonadales bacterium]
MGIAYMLLPIYGFMAEDYPVLRGPWGWREVPTQAPYQQGVVAPGYEMAAVAAAELLQQHRAVLHAPALSAAVVIDGDLIWSAATGWSDLAEQRAATPQTLFRIGSTSKPITGTLLARFIDAGLLDLDTPISAYVTDLPNPQWAAITLRQLASHSSGLPDYETNRDWLGVYQSMALRRHHTDIREGLANFDGAPLRHDPGTWFEYSSYGTNLLAVVLQEVGGKPFQRLIQDWLRTPLGIETPLPDADIPARATFYQLDGSMARRWREVDLSNKLPGGGFMSRPEDLAVLGAAWLDDRFISAETRNEFWTPQRLADGTVNEQAYALTWRWSERSNMANHGGVSKGSKAWLAVYPAQRMVIALTMNTNVNEFSDFAAVQYALKEVFER